FPSSGHAGTVARVPCNDSRRETHSGDKSNRPSDNRTEAPFRHLRIAVLAGSSVPPGGAFGTLPEARLQGDDLPADLSPHQNGTACGRTGNQRSKGAARPFRPVILLDDSPHGFAIGKTMV
ncbi:MAG: hypothetical protein R3D65_00005, partial [Zhengella sp.]|uniref:hypothetical protein n=1 Tax=Zhengella sp. TaxID=2282762 RepID=UPI003528342C